MATDQYGDSIDLDDDAVDDGDELGLEIIDDDADDDDYADDDGDSDDGSSDFVDDDDDSEDAESDGDGTTAESDSDDDDDDDDDVVDLDDDDDPEDEETLEVLLGPETTTTVATPRVKPGDSGDAPPGEGEFTCRSCFLVKRRPQLADGTAMICLDCA